MKITLIQPKKSTRWSMKPSSLVKSVKPLSKRFWNNLRLSTASNSTIQVLLTAEFPLIVTEYCYNPNVYSAIKRSRIQRKVFSYAHQSIFSWLKFQKFEVAILAYWGFVGICGNFWLKILKKNLKISFYNKLRRHVQLTRF